MTKGKEQIGNGKEHRLTMPGRHSIKLNIFFLGKMLRIQKFFGICRTILFDGIFEKYIQGRTKKQRNKIKQDID